MKQQPSPTHPLPHLGRQVAPVRPVLQDFEEGRRSPVRAGAGAAAQPAAGAAGLARSPIDDLACARGHLPVSYDDS